MKIIKFALMMLLLLFMLVDVNAQTVEFKHKSLSDDKGEKCRVEYSVSKLEDEYSLIVKVSSGYLHFLNESSLWIKTFNGDIIKLRGCIIGES